MLKGRKIKKNIIMAILMLSVIPTFLIVAIFHIQYNNSLQVMKQNEVLTTEQAVEYYFKEQISEALSLVRVLAKDPRIGRALKEKDRQTLNLVLKPIFVSLKAETNVGVLEVGDINGIVLMRAGNFEKYGDNKSSYAGVEDALKGQEKSGFALGDSGLMMRGFVPVYYDNKIVGTMQLGIDFTRAIIADLDNYVAGDCAVYVDGKLLGTQTSKNENKSSTLSEKVSKIMMNGGKYEEEIKGEKLRLYLPLKDLAGENILGVLCLDKDVSYFAKMRSNIFWTAGFVCFGMLVIGIFVSLIIAKYITKAENEVEKMYNILEDKVRERTLELSQKNVQLESINKALEEAQEQLVQSEKMKALGSLVAGVAHEINTPVGVSVTAISHFQKSIKDISSLITEGKLKKQDMLDFLQDGEEVAKVLSVNLERASKLVQSFKQVSVDQTFEEKRACNLKRYIEEVLLSLKPELKKFAHTIEVECEEDLIAEIYPGAFAQVLTNFLMNSLMHAFEKESKGQMKIKVSESKDMFEILYSDNGCGMSEDVLTKIFEPFFTTKRNAGGTGLGMHLVYNIITQKFGGTISVKSDLGEGTAFLINFPKNKNEVNN